MCTGKVEGVPQWKFVDGIKTKVQHYLNSLRELNLYSFLNFALYLVHFFTTGSSTLGEIFNPVQSCSDIVDEVPEAEDGFYWIVLPKDPKKTKRKVGF